MVSIYNFILKNGNNWTKNSKLEIIYIIDINGPTIIFIHYVLEKLIEQI